MGRNRAKDRRHRNQHNQAEEFTRKTEDLYRQRDAGMAEINEALRASKNILKGKFTKNSKALGDCGFTVDETPKIKKSAGVKEIPV